MTNPLYYCLRRWQAAGAAGGSAPVATITHSKNGTFTSNWRGTDQAKLTFDWGDGSAPGEITLLGSDTDVPSSHVYSSGVSKTIAIYNNLQSVSRFFLSTMFVTEFDLSSLKNIDFFVMAGNPNLTGISSVSKIASCSDIWLNQNGITDVSPLSNSKATYIALFDNPITYTQMVWVTRTSGTYRFYSTVTTSGEVDQWLIDLNASNWSNCTIYIGGTNPAPTSAAAAALAGLASRGCTVYTN